MNSELGYLGYSLPLDNLPSHFLKNIRSDLYVKPIENPNFTTNITSYPIFRMSKNKIYLPRYYGITEYSQPLKRNFIEPDKLNLTFVNNFENLKQ